jgi:hypothetical protein
MFLWLVYHTCAETLPTDWIENASDRKTRGGRILPLDPIVDDDQNIEIQRWAAGNVLRLNAYGTSPETFLSGPGTTSGPRRFAQHQRPIDLYWEYIGWCRVKTYKPGSFHTFLRVLHKVFGCHLQFRKSGGSQHCECSICNALKREVRNAWQPHVRDAHLEAYFRHIYEQWLDRHVWFIPTVTKLESEANIIK